MFTGKVTCFARSNTPLVASDGAGSGVYLSDWIQVGSPTLMKQVPGGGFTIVRGFVNSDVDGTLDIFQAYSLADIGAVTPIVPPVATGDAVLLSKTLPFTSAGGLFNTGTPYFVAVSAPWVRIRYTNGPLFAQSKFRIHFEVVE